MIFILTMIIFSSSGSAPAAVAVEYNSLEACSAAAKANRENLSSGKVALLTCTKK